MKKVTVLGVVYFVGLAVKCTYKTYKRLKNAGLM